MLTITVILMLAAFICVLAHFAGKPTLAVAVLLVIVERLIAVLPK